jgi:hypothetical protein
MNARGVAFLFVSLFLYGFFPPALAAEPASCAVAASTACYFAPPDGSLHYFASAPPGSGTPTSALIAMHGHPRDANKTFNAALAAAQGAGVAGTTLIVAPVFQVPADQARKCHTNGVPGPRPGDLLWTCESWLSGGAASNAPGVTSFAALDGLVADLLRQWPSLRLITIAGFSAGAQMVQHYIGFAAAPSVTERFVVADPGTWLYFDPVRPLPMQSGQPVDWAQCRGGADHLGGCTLSFTAPASSCADANTWKYGTDALPAALGRNAADARARYAKAEISYIEAALDSGRAPGTSYKVLDKSCAANLQGPFRLQRGLAYAQYDRTTLAPDRQRKVAVVPGCAHNVACVFPAAAARSALLGPAR